MTTPLNLRGRNALARFAITWASNLSKIVIHFSSEAVLVKGRQKYILCVLK